MDSPEAERLLVDRVTAYARAYMARYDGSHDFNHVRRVLALARRIAAASSTSTAPLDGLVITLAALLHDVGDKKYVLPGDAPDPSVRAVLLGMGAPEPLAQRVHTVVAHVSYSAETRDDRSRAAVRDLIRDLPELAVVQDADRLDALGAVGVGRTFAFGGARQRGLEDTIAHFSDKLEKLEALMKTDEGRRLAVERIARLKAFRAWWDDEVAATTDLDLDC